MTSVPGTFMAAHSDEGVPAPGSSIAITPNEGVATQPTNSDATAALRRDEGVILSPHHAAALADASRLEGVTNLRSGKQDSADSTVVKRTAVDLFSGCGGLAHAARLLGFHHLALIESNERCATTLKLNGFDNVVNSPLEYSDLSKFHGADLLTAGPPCQPWSIGGKSLGEEDSRNLWAATVRAIRGIQPKAFLIEMVDGFLRPKFDTARWQLTADLQTLGYHVQISKVNAKDRTAYHSTDSSVGHH